MPELGKRVWLRRNVKMNRKVETVMREIRISDVTMRRAAAVKDLSLSFKEKLEIAKLLDHLGVYAIEVEGIENPKADSLRIKSLASLVRNSVLAVPVKMDVENIDLVWNALKEAAHPRLIVKAAVSPARMEYVYRKKADAMLKDLAMAISECRKRGTCLHESGNGLLAQVGEFTALYHTGLAVLGELAVHVHSAACLARSYLRRECEVHAILVCYLSHSPFGYHQLVCSLFYVNRQELYLVLLVVLSLGTEITHL